jgi:uncharacterized membrane protein
MKTNRLLIFVLLVLCVLEVILLVLIASPTLIDTRAHAKSVYALHQESTPSTRRNYRETAREKDAMVARTKSVLLWTCLVNSFLLASCATGMFWCKLRHQPTNETANKRS